MGFCSHFSSWHQMNRENLLNWKCGNRTWNCTTWLHGLIFHFKWKKILKRLNAMCRPRHGLILQEMLKKLQGLPWTMEGNLMSCASDCHQRQTFVHLAPSSNLFLIIPRIPISDGRKIECVNGVSCSSEGYYGIGITTEDPYSYASSNQFMVNRKHGPRWIFPIFKQDITAADPGIWYSSDIGTKSFLHFW